MAQRYATGYTKFGDLETIKLRHTCILFPRSWPARFTSSDIHRPVSTQDFKFITKLNEVFEFVKMPVESSLSECSML